VKVVGYASALAAVLALGTAVATEIPAPDPATPRAPDAAACAPGSLVVLAPTLIDGTGAPARRVAAVVVRGSRIERIVEEGGTACRGRSIDAEGSFLIPGLWDLHVHLYWAREPALPLLLAHGVTGVRDMGGDLDELLAWRRRIETGELLGPRLVVAGPMLESPEHVASARDRGEPEGSLRNHWPVADAAEARRTVRRLAGLGVDFVKVRTYASPEVVHALAEAARDAGLDLVGHPLWSLDPVEAAGAGMASFEHGFYPWPPDALDDSGRARLIEALVERGTALVPTLVSWEPRARSLARVEARVEDEVGVMDLRRRLVAPELIENWRSGLADRRSESRENLAGWREVLDLHAAEVGALHAAGVRVLPGTDLAGPLIFPGSSLHEELALLVEKAGLTPHEALLSATRDAAEFLHLGDRLGTVEEGKEADVVLLAADPLDDVRNLAAVRGVIARGRYLGPEDLDELLDDVRAAVRRSR